MLRRKEKRKAAAKELATTKHQLNESEKRCTNLQIEVSNEKRDKRKISYTKNREITQLTDERDNYRHENAELRSENEEISVERDDNYKNENTEIRNECTVKNLEITELTSENYSLRYDNNKLFHEKVDITDERDNYRHENVKLRNERKERNDQEWYNNRYNRGRDQSPRYERNPQNYSPFSQSLNKSKSLRTASPPNHSRSSNYRPNYNDNPRTDTSNYSSTSRTNSSQNYRTNSSQSYRTNVSQSYRTNSTQSYDSAHRRRPRSSSRSPPTRRR